MKLLNIVLVSIFSTLMLSACGESKEDYEKRKRTCYIKQQLGENLSDECKKIIKEVEDSLK